MQSAKLRITQIVEDYKKVFADDFQTFKEGMDMQRKLLKDPVYGMAEGTGSDMRALFEIPVDLSEMFITGLSEDEMEWFKAGGADRKEGARWFASIFKVFALPNKI